MPTASVSLPVLPASRPLRLTPTDVSQFVRLERCERFLHFRLAERCFELYERFRPAIPEGVKGWGAKGELDLGLIKALAREKT